jgi:hypothetical protein
VLGGEARPADFGLEELQTARARRKAAVRAAIKRAQS